MSLYNVASAKHATLSTTTPDTVVFSGGGTAIQVINLDATNDLYLTFGIGKSPAAPTALGDDCFVVPKGGTQTFKFRGMVPTHVVLLGNAGAYHVQCLPVG